MQKKDLADCLYGDGQAMAPRKRTDRLFQLPAGSVRFEGRLMDTIRFVEEWQLLDGKLWALFVNQFRSNVDDADHGWRCEYWGKMMRGACFTYACTQNETLYAAMEATVLDLLSTQQEDGRISSYSREVEFHGWDIWGRKYVLLGLQYYLEVCRDASLRARILTAMMRHADCMLEKLGPASEGKLEINEASDHWGGLNSSSVLEPMVRLYNLTGEERYLRFADYIVERGGTKVGNVFEMAYRGRLYPYEYPVTKAYEMMSCFEGLLEYYRVTGVEKWRVAVENFARLVAQSDITIIGCAGCTHELFDHSSVRQLDASEKGIIQETCVTVTWMKLCYQLLSLTGDSFFADRMEQSIYNALLGSVNTEKCVTNNGLPFDSYSPILPGTRGRKTGGLKAMENGAYYGCCAAIGAAGTGMVGLCAAMQAKDGLAVNLYLQGSVHAFTPQGGEITLQTETEYPADGEIHMTVSLGQDEELALYLRIPEWSRRTLLQVNGETLDRIVPGNYVRIFRTWRNGDRISLSLDMRTRRIRPEEYQVSSQDTPYAAFCRGPLVLARDARLGGDVDAPICPVVAADGFVETKPAVETRLENQVACDLPTEDGGFVRLIDYASAGKSWDERSRMAAWIPMR